MSDQSQPTCSICGTVIEGDIFDIKMSKERFFYISHRRTGAICIHCGAYVCRSCEPTAGFLITFGLKKETCPKCGKPNWWAKGYWVYTCPVVALEASRMLDGNIPDDAKQRAELLVFLDHCRDQIVELIFQDAEKQNLGGYNQGNRLLKLANIAKIGAVDAFQDGKIETRLSELSLNHHAWDVRYHACITLIRIEDIFRTGNYIPTLLKALESEKHPYAKEQIADNLVTLSWNKDIIDGLIKSLLGDRDVTHRQTLAGTLHKTIGKDHLINDRVVLGLSEALKDHSRPPKPATSVADLFNKEPSVSERAAKSLEIIGTFAVDAVPALIQALSQSEFLGSQSYTKALCAISGMDFGSNADKWQKWWDEKQIKEANLGTGKIRDRV